MSAKLHAGRSFVAWSLSMLCCGPNPTDGDDPSQKSIRAELAFFEFKQSRNADEAFAAIDKSFPGFAGLHFASGGASATEVRVKRGSRNREELRELIARIALDSNKSDEAINFNDVEHSFSDLLRIRSDVLNKVEGNLFSALDIDETIKKVVVYAADEQKKQIILSRLENKLPGVVVRIQPHMTLTAGLADLFRPTPAGVKLTKDGGKVCTTGYSVFHSDRQEFGFLTAAHCTHNWGFNDNTWFAQPGGGWFWADKLGEERLDPVFFSGTQDSLRIARRRSQAHWSYRLSSELTLGLEGSRLSAKFSTRWDNKAAGPVARYLRRA